jgi:hypothetical protein
LPPSEAVAIKCEIIALLPRVSSHDLAISLILEVTPGVLRPFRVRSKIIVLFVHMLWLVLMLLVYRRLAISTDPVIVVLVI